MTYPTKNVQPLSVLQKLIQHAFPQRKFAALHELKEGYFNVAYEVVFEDGASSILKIAPRPEVPVLAHEHNLMEAEVYAMQLVAQQTNLTIPEVEFYDPSCTLCSAPYFFMKKIIGQSLVSQKSNLSSQQLSEINTAVGTLNKEINQITNDFFGYPAQPHFQGKQWHDVFVSMISAVITDAQRYNIDLTIPTHELLESLVKDKAAFLEITTPRLVHWDLWDGNIFVADGQITGLIDWERCIWGDPLLEVGFRSYAQSSDFLNGYGMGKLTETAYRRMLWYDLYYLMIAAQEYVYRQYETADSYDWATQLLHKKYEELKTMLLEPL